MLIIWYLVYQGTVGCGEKNLHNMEQGSIQYMEHFQCSTSDTTSVSHPDCQRESTTQNWCKTSLHMLVVSIQLKNILQVGSFSQKGVKVFFSRLKSPSGETEILLWIHKVARRFLASPTLMSTDSTGVVPTWWVMWAPLVIQEMFHPGKPYQSPQMFFWDMTTPGILHPQIQVFRGILG